MAVHFIGFRDDRYHNAVRVFGQPDFIHRHWDVRAMQEIAEGDVVVFAKGAESDPPCAYTLTTVRTCNQVRNQ